MNGRRQLVSDHQPVSGGQRGSTPQRNDKRGVSDTATHVEAKVRQDNNTPNYFGRIQADASLSKHHLGSTERLTVVCVVTRKTQG